MSRPKLILFGDPQRPYAKEALDKFAFFVKDKADLLTNCLTTECSIEQLRQADYAVVFGGDGTILAAAKRLCETHVPVIGVNVGKLGFLAEFSVDELIRLFDQIMARKTLIEERMILHCCLKRDGEEILSMTAVNDVVISAGAPFSMIDLQISVQGQDLAGCIGDGVILSTPTGSTAYNMSAGGPILSGNLSAMVITPICPHSLSFRPVVINAENTVQIQPIRVNKNTSLILDGHVQYSLRANDLIEVKKHDGLFFVVNNPMRTQWDTLATKLNWAGKPKYNDGRSNL